MLGSWKRFWDAEEIRILVLASMFLQFILIILAPMRKRTAHTLIIFVIWFSYQLADYVAILALANIVRKQNNEAAVEDVMPFWAPFLLLHLGGPDTITSYSIEDNELWVRHLLKLAVQVVVAFIALFELWEAGHELRFAATFVFLAGFVKYAERTWALRAASMDKLRNSMTTDPDPGPNYVEFMEEYVWRREAGQSGYVKRKNEQPQPARIGAYLDESCDVYDSQYLVHAYGFFKKFRPLVVDLMLSFLERDFSQPYFWDKAGDSFRVVEMELSFIYDMLHTKTIYIRCVCGWVWRFCTFMIVLTAFVLFLILERKRHANTDIIISYVLLGAALFMEIFSLVLITVSDWMIVVLKKYKNSNILATFICKIVSRLFPKGKRWSNSMNQYCLLSFSLRDKNTWMRKVLRVIELYEYWVNITFVNSIDVPSRLKDLLFEDLKANSRYEQDMAALNELRKCRGEKTLDKEGCTHLRWSIDKEFDECVLLWHVATDLCYHTRGNSNQKLQTPEQGMLKKMMRCVLNLCAKKDSSSQSISEQEISFITSNYMVYLLIMQPGMLPNGIGKIRFQDTCAEAKVFFKAEEKGLKDAEAREALLNVDTDLEPVEVKGDRSKSVLFSACRLAKQLNLLPEDQRWRLVRQVWVEILSYAASNCKTYSHAKQLSQGGELLTHVWLLMAHMGIGEHYRIEAGHGSPTLSFD